MIFMGFLFLNWRDSVAVRFWPLRGEDNLLFEWPVAFVAIFFFLLGFLPTWLLHRSTKWRLARRIKALEAAARIPHVAPADPGFGQSRDIAEPSPSPAPPSTFTPNNPV